MKRINKFFTGTAIGVILIAFFSNWLYANFKTIPVLNSVLSFFIIIKNFITSILRYKIEVWIVLVIAAFAILLLYLLKNVNIEKPPAYATYTEDQFKSWVWRWQYDSLWQVSNLAPYCPVCKVELITRSIQHRDMYWPAHAMCPKCERQWDKPSISYPTSKQNPPTEYINETQNLIEARINEIIQDGEKRNKDK